MLEMRSENDRPMITNQLIDISSDAVATLTARSKQ